MTIKHLPGKHNQQKHASVSKYRFRRDLSTVHVDYSGFGNYEPTPGAFNTLAGDIFAKYKSSYRLRTRPAIRIEEPAFHAELDCYKNVTARSTYNTVADSTVLGIEFKEVSDPEEAEKFIRNTIKLAKQVGYKSLVLDRTVPLGLSAELGAHLSFYGDDDLSTLFVNSFDHLEETYGIARPQYLEVDWLEKQGVHPIKTQGPRQMKVMLSELLNVKHPNHPEVPLLLEHLSGLHRAYEIDLTNAK